MSNIYTSPLQKTIPSLTPALSQSEWSIKLGKFLSEKQIYLSDLASTFQKNIGILEHQKEQTSLLIAILEECGGLTVRARNMMATPTDIEKYKKNISEFEEWFRLALIKLDKAVAQAEFNNINLLNGGKLETPLDQSGQSKLITEGLVLTSEVLGIRSPDFSSLFTVQNSRIDVMNAIDMVVTIRNVIASHISILTIGLEVATHSSELSAEAQSLLGKTDLLTEIKALQDLASQGNGILGSDPLAEPSQQETLNSFASSPSMEGI